MGDEITGDGGVQETGGEIQQTTETGSVSPEAQAPETYTPNPAWEKVLSVIPESLHPAITPELKRWDDNYARDVSEVQSQIAQYEAFKDISPDEIQQAIAFRKLAEENPQYLYEEMGKFYNFVQQQAGGQGQEGQPSTDEGLSLEDLGNFDGNIEDHPKFKELAESQQALAQVILGQEQQRLQAEASIQIDNEIKQITETMPQFKTADGQVNEDAMVTVLEIAGARNISLTDAAKVVAGLMGNAPSAPSAPRVMSPGGGIPATPPIDPAGLDKNATRDLVADMVRNATQQGN